MKEDSLELISMEDEVLVVTTMAEDAMIETIDFQISDLTTQINPDMTIRLYALITFVYFFLLLLTN